MSKTMGVIESSLFRWLLFINVVSSSCCAHLLAPAILSTTFQLKGDTVEYIGFPQSALNGTEVEIRLQCVDDSDLTFEVQYVIRSSPCDKEFFDTSRQGKVKDLLNFYFEHEWEVPPGYKYGEILFYKSQAQRFNCRQSHGIMVVREDGHPRKPLQVHKVKQATSTLTNSVRDSQTATSGILLNYASMHRHRRKSEIRLKREFAGLNGDSLDGGAKKTLSSWHPVQKLPADGIYFLVIKFTVIKYNTVQADSQAPFAHNLTVDVQWRGPNGYLSAIDYPLLRFYAFMWFFYAVLALIWLFCCMRYWMDILRIQFCIGAVIIVGMIEKAMFYSEYSTMNEDGTTVHGFIEAAELVSCLKRTMSRVLIIIVSLGYGVVKPRLGNTLNQVIAVGFVYFIFSAVEALARVSKNQVEGMKQRQVAALPLLTLEVAIFWWILTSLLNTMRVLKMRRNLVKLSVYRHFTNALCLAALISAVFMCWTIYIHNMQQCLIDWKDYWVDTAFWHILFCSVLVIIMILWRPSRNNQRYAFTPLLDDSEDENDEDELFNTNFYAVAALNQRTGGKGVAVATSAQEVLSSKKQKETFHRNQNIQKELKWIEDNIPSTLADRLLVDDEDDREKIELERSKML